MSNHGTAIGIELDTHSLRAAKVKYGGSGKKDVPVIAAIEEVSGNFVKDEEVIDGLKALRQRLSVSPFDTIVTCVGGKQTYAAQMSFKKLPDEEMRTALKFEIRKNLPFDTAGATIEYQYLSHGAKKSETAPVIVTAVSNIILQRYLRLFEKAGMSPQIIDVFPLTLANAYHAGNEQHNDTDKNGILLHIGNDYSTLVIDGATVPFFNRTIYFSAGELFGPSRNETLAPREIERRIGSFSEEVVRSLSYYETTFHTKSSNSISVLGNFSVPDLLQKIGQDTGMSVTLLDLVKAIDAKRESTPGKFDIALTLGMRG